MKCISIFENRIDTEDKLIECKEHLIQYNIIGVDLEHYGENDVSILS